MKQLKATVKRRRRYFKDVKPQIRDWYKKMGLWRCCRCNDCRDIELHHCIPLEHGGTNNLYNIVPICSICHSELHFIMGIEYKER